MTDIKIDLVDSVTRLELQETITYAERTIAASGISLTEGEKEGIEALREQIELHSEVSKATFRLDAEDAENARTGILKGLPEGSDDVVSNRFFGIVFDVDTAARTLSDLFAQARPVGYDLQVKLVEIPHFPYGDTSRRYYLGLTDDGEEVAIRVEVRHEVMSRLGSDACRKYHPVMNLVDCAEEPRAFPYKTAFPQVHRAAEGVLHGDAVRRPATAGSV